jgi:hypothetical protein
VSGELLLPLAAFLSAAGGFIATLAAMRRQRRDALDQAEDECHKKLLLAHRESQELIEEITRLHKERG